MLDTKLKKTNKRKAAIITLIVMLPALILTCLYPGLEKAVMGKMESIQEMDVEMEPEERFIVENFPSYALEAAYYIYANEMINQGESVSLAALEQYGWDEDYRKVYDNTAFYAEIGEPGEGVIKKDNYSSLELSALLNNFNEHDASVVMEEQGISAYLELIFDQNGNMSKVSMTTAEGYLYMGNARAQAEESIEQYEANCTWYAEEQGNEAEELAIKPKNFRAVFAIPEGKEQFIEAPYSYDEEYWFEENYVVGMYSETGALAAILVLAALVALAALILPFFKGLDTGWEKVFSLPFEVMMLVFGIGLGGAIFLYETMAYMTAYKLRGGFASGALEFLGLQIQPETCYVLFLICSFLGWTVLFWMEYMTVTSFRQFCCRPKYYIKERVLAVRAVRWCVEKVRKCVTYITDCDLGEAYHKRMLLAIGINAVVIALFCSGWFFGILGVVIYSVFLYVQGRKWMEKIQKDYGNVKETVHQMAEGNLNIEVPAELGMFQSLGSELVQVKDGFSKAVAEEAKSQNMKTELITNVSHDLKTPLTAIITYVDLLGKEGITEEERRSYIATLEKKSQRLKVLIEDLFEVSKASSGNVKLNLMDVDVVGLMKQVRTEMEDKIADSDLSFRWNLPEGRLVLRLDGQKTYRVFENLLNNILKYAMPHSRVYIDVAEYNEEIRIMFRNMSKVELGVEAEHLTDRFVRGEAARSSEGSGLGLAIAKSFVELQGGTFKIEIDGDLFKVVVSWRK